MKKIKKVIALEGNIHVISGLRIGGSSDEIRIGGVDSEVVKHPITLEPYIPGSSLKGKMRSLLEAKYGRFDFGRKAMSNDRGEPCKCGQPDCMICTLFGAHKNTQSLVAPPRMIVRDCMVSKDNAMGSELDQSYYEKKAENVINRKTGTADSPRFMERVVPGVIFDYSIVLTIYEDDDEQRLKSVVEEGLRMVQNNYLGGRGSAGSGQVSFTDEEGNLPEWKEIG